MCSLDKTLLGRAHMYMDQQRTKLANKIGLPPLRDPLAEGIGGKSRSLYGKAPKAQPLAIPTTSTNTGLQIPT